MSITPDNTQFPEQPPVSSVAAPWVARLSVHVDGTSDPELEAAYRRARQMLAANLLDPAQAVLEALLLLQPRAVRFARLLGIVYLRKQWAHKARAMLAYAIELDAQDLVLHLLHGECVLLCGERELGIQLLERALGAAQRHPDVHAYIMRAQKSLRMARQAAP